jgi:hypothetical protein
LGATKLGQNARMSKRSNVKTLECQNARMSKRSNVKTLNANTYFATSHNVCRDVV